MVATVREWNRRRLRKVRLQKNLTRLKKINLEQFAKAGIPAPDFTIEASEDILGTSDVILRREGGETVALCNGCVDWKDLVACSNKIAAYLHWFLNAPNSIREIVVNASDGDIPGNARYSFSTTTVTSTPLPDAHFFRNYGYRATDAYAASNAVAWADRSDDIVWRGQTNGVGLYSLDKEMSDIPGVIQRLRMALKCQEIGVDFRFIPRPNRPSDRLLADAGLVGDYIPTHDWGGMKYAIDIDGFTNAWCNLMQRLKLGCCVLKVESPFGYYQWYYHRLVAWEHFVPIRADLADLAERVDWVRTHPEKARDIATRGQELAREMTFESECKLAAEAIEEREMSL